MDLTKRDFDEAYAKHKAQQGGAKEDYFALISLTREFDKAPEQVSRAVDHLVATVPNCNNSKRG